MATRMTWYGKTPKGVECEIIRDTAATTDAAIAKELADFDAALVATKFERSARLDPQPRWSGGGGGGSQYAAKPETPAPQCIVVPDHDGQKMRFIPPTTREDGTGVGPRFTCRAGKQCSEKNDKGYPFASWDMKPAEGFTAADVKKALAALAPGGTPAAAKPKAAAAPPVNGGAPAQNGDAPAAKAEKPKPANWTPFWRRMDELRWTREQVFKQAGVENVTGLIGKVKTADDMKKLQDELEALARGEAPT